VASGEVRSDEAAERYASALFDLAAEGGDASIDATAADASALKTMLAESEDLQRLVESPAFSAEDKQAALTAVADKARFGPLLRRFLGVLAGNRRAASLAGVLVAFERLVAAHRGVTVAEVTTARALTDKEAKALALALKSTVGRDVEMRVDVRPEILGGLIVKVGSRMFDSSLRTKLQGLKAAMKGA
jgi:F-type H+-transporting ATPase subunit delta